MGAAGLWQGWRPGDRHAPGRRPGVRHPAAAAQRHGHAAHGPRLQPDHHGQPNALPPHEGLQHGVGARHRPRRHRHADRGGAPVARPGHQPPRHGPHARRGAQELRGQGVGVEGAVGQHHHHADAPHGRQRGLEPRVLHHGRQTVQGGDRNLRHALPAGPHLPRQAPGQLGPGAAKRRVRPGGGKRRGRRLALAHRLPPGQWRRATGGGHHPPRDPAGRRGRDGPPRGRALRPPDRPIRQAAAV